MLTKLVSELKILLSTVPYDIGHDVAHHHQVWCNCNWIIEAEHLEGVDMDALQIAAWSHDLERGSETHIKLQKLMEKYGFKKNFTKKILSIINEHSHDDDQTSLESKILFDADKLEYVGLLRWQAVFRAQVDRYTEKGHLEKYGAAWNKRIEYIPQKLHFNSTRKKFSEDLSRVSSWAEKQGIFKNGRFIV